MSTIIAQKYWVPNEFGFAIMDWASIWSHNWSKSTLQNCSRLILPTIAIAFAILFTFKGETEIFLGLLSFLIWHKLILEWTTHSLRDGSQESADEVSQFSQAVQFPRLSEKK